MDRPARMIGQPCEDVGLFVSGVVVDDGVDDFPAGTAGIEAVAYGEGLADRLRKFGLQAFIDCHGGGYVNLAIELGVPKDRIDTIIDFAAAQQYGVKTEGSQEARNSRILAELAGLVAEGKLDVPVAATFPLADVRAAFRQLEQGHTRGKIVLAP
jgi:NADPH:quinone reductase-like Zn-dependent oxidoreductase